MSWNNLYLPFADLYPYRSDQSFTPDYAPISSPIDAHSSSSTTSVKIEPDDPDTRFIMELAAFPPSSRSSPESYAAYNDFHSSAPPSEVPLRATQASKEMRLMMGVFRLNPFAMHSLSRGGEDDTADGSPTGSATWCREAGPLEEEPVMFEFQLDLSGLDREDDSPIVHAAEPSSRLPAMSAHDESQLRAFSPSFELHEGDPSERHEQSSISFGIQRDVHDQQALSERDPGNGFRQGQSDPWEEADYPPQSGSDSGTSCSTTLSVRTPLNESSCSPFDNGSLTQMQDHLARRSGCAEQTQTSPTVEFPSTPSWDVSEISDNYQVQEAGPSMNYGDISHRGGIAHLNTSHPSSHPYMRMTYPPPSYTRRSYAQPNAQFQQAQGQPNFFLHTNRSPSLLHNAGRPIVHQSQEIESVPQSPSSLSPLSPARPNSFQYQEHNHYQSQHPSPSPTHQHHSVPYSPSNPISMPLRLPISVARSAIRSAAAYSNAGSPTGSQSQLPPLSTYNMLPRGRGYRVSGGPHLEERIAEHEVYGTPHSPVNEDREGYDPTTPVVTMGMPIPVPMHPVLHRSSTYAGGHLGPQLVTGGAVDSSSGHGHPNTNNRRWSLPEMSVGAQGESFLGHHM